MNTASRRTDAGAPDRRDRLQRWSAALFTVLLHGLLVLLALLSRPVTVTTQGASGGGSSLEVTYIEDVARPPLPSPRPPTRTTAADPPAKAPPATTRVRSTQVARADDPVLPVDDATTDSQATSRATQPTPDPPEPTPSPPDVPDDAAERETAAPIAETAPPIQRPTRMKGLPPGMRLEDLAPARAQRGRGPAVAVAQGRGSGAGTSGASMGVDGYQVYYELVYETRLRAWRDQGMTELFLPLPGTRRLMVCPLEIALRRGSGACRMVEPDAPELASIGDARDVVFMQRVYRLGEAVWTGPGPYR